MMALILTAFCALLVCFTLARLAFLDDREYVEIGSFAVVIGLTILSLAWSSLEREWLSSTRVTIVAINGAVLVGLGLVVIGHYWQHAT